MAYRTIIIEDQQLFRSLMVNHLNHHEDFEMAGEAATGEDGWALFEELRPDLILLDIILPDTDGLEIAARILNTCKSTKILAITSQMDSFTTNRIYEIGFHGYVEKEQPIQTLEEAMLTVAEGGLYFTQLLRENRHKIATDPEALQKILSLHEQKILHQVSLGATSQEIADRLQLSRRTIENHRYRIMKKLNIKNISELVKFTLAQGKERGADLT